MPISSTLVSSVSIIQLLVFLGLKTKTSKISSLHSVLKYVLKKIVWVTITYRNRSVLHNAYQIILFKGHLELHLKLLQLCKIGDKPRETSCLEGEQATGNNNSDNNSVIIEEEKITNLHFNHLLQITTLKSCFKDECIVHFLMEDLFHRVETSHLGIHKIRF